MREATHPHPRCFAKRVRKLLKIKDAGAKKSAKREQEAASRYKQKSWQVARLRLNFFGRAMGDTPGVLYRCETTRVARKGFCKFLKTKATKNRWWSVHDWVVCVNGEGLGFDASAGAQASGIEE